MSTAELRLAVAFTGGVSLAVWMGGVSREMNLLVSAAAEKRGGRVPAGPTESARRVRECYRKLLRVLDLDVSVDVLSGTSAGGINAACLGLATARGTDLGGLRELWLRNGQLEVLLRDPAAEEQPPSLLQGDGVLLKGLNEAMRQLAGDDAGSDHDEDEDATRVLITTTLLDGLPTPFPDDYGTTIRDTSHLGLFTFDGKQLRAPGAPAALALAARSSASFPGAFEPAFVPVGRSGDAEHPDMKPYVRDHRASQYCADGGLLANRPVGPALQAIFDRPAHRQVRRVLAYVVPSPGAVPDAHRQRRDEHRPHSLASALVADLNAALSQTITADLAALAAHNSRARARRRGEVQLARLLGAAVRPDPVRLADDYRERRVGAWAEAAAQETMRQLAAPGRIVADGAGPRPAGFGSDLEILTAAARDVLLQKLPLNPADPDPYARMTAYGRQPLDGAKATVLELLNACFASRPGPQERADIGALADSLHQAMPKRVDSRLAEGVTDALDACDLTRPGAVTRLAGSGPWHDAVLSQLPKQDEQSNERDELRAAWVELARVAGQARRYFTPPDSPAPDGTPSADDIARAEAADVFAYLDGAVATRDIAGRLFDLQAALRVIYPDEQAARQTVELVQMSADTRTLLDPRSLASDKLTGLQLHHFGAFYKHSWRANDWMWGRLDGAGWLVHVLLSPRHLARLAREADSRTAFREDLRGTLEEIAGEPPPHGVFERFEDGTAAELDFLDADVEPPAAALPTTAMWVAAGLQRLIGAEELVHVARHAETEDPNTEFGEARDAFVAAVEDRVGRLDQAERLPARDVQDVLAACRVSEERFSGERETPLFRRTAVTAAAVGSGAAVGVVGRRLRTLRTVLRTVRRALLLAVRMFASEKAARKPVGYGLAAVTAGVAAATSSVREMGYLGLLAVLAGIALIAVGAGRRVRAALTMFAGAVVLAGIAVIALAGFIPAVDREVFPWLLETAVPYLDEHAVVWAIVVLLVVLLPLSLLLDGAQALRARRRHTTAAASAEPAPTAPAPLVVPPRTAAEPVAEAPPVT
ncbi:patatin-like protein [Streptomyces sp. NPDC051940]|uniref:patatin-like protein n=1 Tax=Streptomyces sp. NPDC051940 TaxID=3155675 RepID=UPI00342C6A4A